MLATLVLVRMFKKIYDKDIFNNLFSIFLNKKLLFKNICIMHTLIRFKF
jgi:hypothetical protein